MQHQSDCLNAVQVGIALAVYQGEKFLPEQLESIIAQNYQNWVLFVRDDGSKDGSGEIIARYSEMERRIHFLMDAAGKRGARGNFCALMQSEAMHRYDYMSFADQDDVWSQDKLSRQLDLMRDMEGRYPDTALLVYSDMTVVDAALETISPSFMAHEQIRHEYDAVPVLLAQNFVAGCTMMANRKLLDIALPVPEEALLHDWWLALCAAVFGQIGYIDQPLLKYRQHGHNEVGAKQLRDFLNPLSGKWKARWLEGYENLRRSMEQAQVLAERIQTYDPSNPYLSLVKEYAALRQYSAAGRLKKLKQLGVHAQSKTRHALLLSRLMLMGKG